MSFYICAHGELYSKCEYCSAWEEEEYEFEDDLEEYVEPEQKLSTFIRLMKKTETIEY